MSNQDKYWEALIKGLTPANTQEADFFIIVPAVLFASLFLGSYFL